MRISPVSSNFTVKRPVTNRHNIHNNNSVNFKGWKGAGIGLGAGTIWAGIIIGMTAVSAPYLLPFAGEALALGAGTGAFAGHCMENELKGDDDKKK